ncbi:hypothetical protein CTA2_10624 [Colletotrichum tanaceti]|nr:hypothetical protein CTA2_10624 [Colletotrichum tanaceti]
MASQQPKQSEQSGQPGQPPAAAVSAPPTVPVEQEETKTTGTDATTTTGPAPAPASASAPDDTETAAFSPAPTAPEADDDGDADSALGDDTASSTASLTSTILQYRKIHGRTFHGEVGDAQYYHHLLTLSMGDRLHLAPLNKNKLNKALDIGTGTVIWAIDVADENPECEVIGTDISPIQPSWVPPNLKFGPLTPETFDYVHIRFLVGSIPDWPALFRQAYRALKPGGYLESFEPIDDTVPETSALGQWGKFFEEGGRKMGRTFMVLDEQLQRRSMEEAGFERITEWNSKEEEEEEEEEEAEEPSKGGPPIGSWPRDPAMREIGEWAQLTLLSDIEGYVLFMANVMSTWSRKEIQIYAA